MSRSKGERKVAPAPEGRTHVVDRSCLEALQWWTENDARIAAKALALIDQVLRDPFSGPGKPEPLEGLMSNTWSRRITVEHRLVHVISDDRIVFVQVRYHYRGSRHPA